MGLIKGDFLKSLVVLLSGTLIAQLLNVAFIPVLSRVYSPDELGVLNFYIQIVTFVTAIVTLRLELSLPLEKYEGHRYTLFRYALRWTFLLSIVSFLPIIIVLTINDFQLVFSWLLLLIPIGVLLHALFNLGMYWELGQSRYSKITYAKLTRSGTVNGLKWGFGLMNWGALGLIISVLIGTFLSVLVFAKGFSKSVKSIAYSSKSVKTKFLAYKHRDFYLFNLPHTLIDITRDVVLAGFIMYSFSEHDYGSFSTSYMVLRLPLVFIGEAVGQALFSKCTKLYEERQKLSPFVTKLVLGLVGVSIIPFVTIYFFGTEIFTFVLGPKWVDAGHYSEIITWWSMIIFITSPLSFIPIVLNRQRSYFAINILRTCCLIGAVYIPIYINPSISFETSLGIIALTQISINVILLVYYKVIITINDNQIEA